MKLLPSPIRTTGILFALLASALPASTLTAVGGFAPVNDPAYAPYYRETSSPQPTEHGVAIATDRHRDKPAAAEVVFEGKAGRYDLTLLAVAEEDGESRYQIWIDGRALGERQNLPQLEKRWPVSHRWMGVALAPGARVRVVFAGHTNGKIPEGDSTAWSRGRWRSLTISETPPPPHAVPTTAKPTHVFRDGIALIEAESGQGGWERIVDQGTQAIRAVASAEMQYRVQFPEAGFYFVHLRAHYAVGFKTPEGKVLETHSTNDAHVLVGGARLYGSDLTTRPEGMRCHSAEFRWWNLPKGPGGHTPEVIKEKPVQAYIPAAGVYDVTIRYRSPALVIDKLAFTRGKEAPADNVKETAAQR